jgi:hypothetical protein
MLAGTGAAFAGGPEGAALLARLWTRLTGAGPSGTAAATAGTKLAIQFGKTASQVEHAVRHMDEIGMDRGRVGAAIGEDLQSAASLLQPVSLSTRSSK